MIIKQKTNKTVLTFAFIIPILWIIFAYFFIENKVTDLKHQKFSSIASTMQDELSTLINEKAEAVLLIAISISDNYNVNQVLLGSQKSLNLDNFSQTLKENTSLKHIWFQVITPDGTSIYRSWTQKKGDNLSQKRLDIAQMIKNPKISSSISTGKFDLSFKSMLPIYNQDKFIGFIEVIAKVNSIAIKLAKKDYNLVALVDKKYKTQLTNAFTQTFVEDYYVANLHPKKELLDMLAEKKVSHFLDITKFHQCENPKKLHSTYHLKDIHNKEMAYFILFYDTKNINMTEIMQSKDRLTVLFLIAFFILIIFIYYFYSKKYKTFMASLDTSLEEEIISKTQELQEQSDALEHIANHDSLTGLPNRLLFLDRLKQAIKHAKRAQSSVSVLFLDLDRFKDVNDTYGHAIGDKLLQKVSEKLRQSVREEDSISRLGGDEFTVILEDANEADIIKVTQKIISLMQEKFIIENATIYTTFSIGISRFPEDGTSPDILLRNADTAMYKAKDMGKNQYQFYNQKMTEIAIKRTKIENDLRLALENNEFEAYYQAKVDAKNGTIIGMEALIRWQHPESGLILPDTFIKIAEEIGLIVSIDKWMMQHTLNEMKNWHNLGLNTGKLSLNLSIKQLENSEYLSNIKELISDIKISPKYLELEITESQIMNDPESAIAILSKIRELGIGISVDDFGTGYSSLSYLKKLPIDKLKIDRSFVNELPYDENDVAIVKSIVALANSLNLELIAEGVETKEQLDFLVSIGCHNIQGYYYSKPLPAHKYKEFLLKYQ